MRLLHFFRLEQLLCILMLAGITGVSDYATAADQEKVDFSQLKDYAIFADAAYLGEPQVREISHSKNYILSQYGNIPDLAITYYLLTNEESRTQIIAVRGTSNIENALLDVDVKLVTDLHAGIRLHKGFSQAAEKIYREVKSQLKTDYTISTTGHSLGGAVAMILAIYLDVDQFDVNHVVTFGQPKVTNITGAEKFRHLNITRVVTPNDLVPLMPPLDPMEITDLDVYWHAGKEIILLSDTDYAVLEGMDSMLRAAGFTQEPLTESNIQNHQIARYLSILESKISDARRVPFTNDLNLFNLFGTKKQDKTKTEE